LELKLKIQKMMNLKAIQDLITLLRQSQVTTSFKCLNEKLVQAGLNDLLIKLDALLTEKRDEIEIKHGLKAILYDYWTQYQTTPLSYTCIPHHPLTHLCIELAVFAVEPGENPLTFLMPGFRIHLVRLD
jgi:hypothetical protein